ncbi:MAG: SH3 domain-containing protein [Spirochaetes bacterium]|nr:SH3 domain-containing protein [Spirochaetota bacterium]
MRIYLRAGAWALMFLIFLPLRAQGQTEMTAMSVQVAMSQIRKAPSVAAPIIESVAYRQKLFVFGTMDGWTKVRVPGSSRYGYIFASALTAKTIPVTVPGAAVQGVSETEISLAGKGFDQSLEDQYRQKTHVDFVWVDKMEKLAYTPEACLRFLEGSDDR